MRALFILLFAASLISGCGTSKNTGSNVISILHGTSFGHCVGYCIREEIHTKESLTFIKRSNQDAQYPETRTDEPQIVGVDNSKQIRFDKMVKSFKMEDFNALPETIGCPDCADGGAEYIEIKTSQGTKRVTFEFGQEPEGMKDLLVILRASREKVEE